MALKIGQTVYIRPTTMPDSAKAHSDSRQKGVVEGIHYGHRWAKVRFTYRYGSFCECFPTERLK